MTLPNVEILDGLREWDEVWNKFKVAPKFHVCKPWRFRIPFCSYVNYNSVPGGVVYGIQRTIPPGGCPALYHCAFVAVWTKRSYLTRAERKEVLEILLAARAADDIHYA